MRRMIDLIIDDREQKSSLNPSKHWIQKNRCDSWEDELIIFVKVELSEWDGIDGYENMMDA